MTWAILHPAAEKTKAPSERARPVDDFDEAEYKAKLIAAGTPPEVAADIAAKTACAHAARPEPVRAAIFPPLPDELTSGAAPAVKPPTAKPVPRPLAPKRQAVARSTDLVIDFNKNPTIPAWVREVIDTSLAIEAEDAKSAGSLGFTARALVVASMPYRDPKADVYTRQNGDFKLRILAGYEGGIPYGIYPRLLTSWVVTEAVRTGSPYIELGESLRDFFRNVLELRSTGGGKRGSASSVTEQMKRLFGALITAQYSGATGKRGFTLKNVLIADDLTLSDHDADRLDNLDAPEAVPGQQPAEDAADALWLPQPKHMAGQWQSQVTLSQGFFDEVTSCPVPIDLRAYKSLRGSALAMDVYTWLTHRLSYLKSRSRPIPWESLMMQFGSNFQGADHGQNVRNFRKDFIKALKMVLLVYPGAKVEVLEQGLVLLPSGPHIPRSVVPRLPSQLPLL